jgi:hypothetical protein
MGRYNEDNLTNIKSIQRINASHGRTNTTYTATISAIDTSKSFLISNQQGYNTYSVHRYTHGGDAYQNNYGQVGGGTTTGGARITSSTQIQYGAYQSGTYNTNESSYHCMQVIEYE